VQDKSEKLGVTAWIYTHPGGSVLESSASFEWIENEIKCLPHSSFGEVLFQHHFNGNICYAPQVSSASFLWIENETKHLLTRFLQPYFTD